SVRLLGVAGDDEAGRSLRAGLEAAGVMAELQTSPAQATITKLRVVSHNQQLIRLDFEESVLHESADEENDFLARFSQALPAVRAAVLSDYGKGTLTRIPAMVEAARKTGVPV